MPTWKDIDRDIQLTGYGKGTTGYQGQFNSAYANSLLSKGFTANDINQYLAKSGIKPVGNEFAVGGNFTQFDARGTQQGDGFFYKMVGGGGAGAGGAGGGGSSNSNPNYGSGKYNDITAALQQQAAAGNAAATNYQTQAAEMQAQIAAIKAANELSISNANKAYEAQLADSKKASEAQIKQLQDAMVSQQNTYQQQLLLAQQQQQQAATSLAEQQRQNAALQTAFVPNLEPTAAYNAIGDNREAGAVATRKAENNKLSSLSIINPYAKADDSLLAGLQLA